MGRIAREIRMATDSLGENSLAEEELPTAGDISRILRLKPDKVKKRLKILLKEGVVEPVSYTPKRYRFDYYRLQQLDESSELYPVLMGAASPYRIH